MKDFREDFASLIWAYGASRPRSLQQELGPSEIGVACDRQLAYRIARTPPAKAPQAAVGPLEWASFVGSAMHDRLADVLRWGNVHCEDRYRYIEQRLALTEYGMEGTVDAYDAMEREAIDWKTASPAVLAEVRRSGPKPDHDVQLDVYGLMLSELGEDVRSLRIVYLPRNGGLSGMVTYARPFRAGAARGHMERYVEVKRDTAETGPLGLPATGPCRYCEFKRPGPATVLGCPGVEGGE